MKLLTWHCAELRYVDKVPSTRPQGIEAATGRKSEGSFSDVVAAFACVEEGDGVAEVQSAAESVVSIVQMLGPKRDVVLIPFAHLSSKLASPDASSGLLGSLASLLTARSITVHRVSFGYHKEFELHYKAYGHPGSVAYRSFPGGS